MIQVQIYRYNPDLDNEPRMENYQVEESFRQRMVLDVLEHLKERDPSLTYRRSCREGVCGSDGMNINGQNALACVSQVSDILAGTWVAQKSNYGSGVASVRKAPDAPLVIRPLTGMPVIRDLVVDQTHFFDQYRQIKPWLINDEPPPAIERLQSPEDRARLDGLYECILCGCCTSGCPSWWWNPDKYLGPAVLLQAQRFLEDSRDSAGVERLTALEDHYSVFRCRDIENCAQVCPKGLNPMKAISGIRRRLLTDSS
ncbi:succinate dehydrogenase iron-sulfur subunit [Haliea sp. E1-2-M8]|uniref:succinate dehydrogenase iron-sulfur subunit n=1 Tax=Haliea sp. E1-2-M8 TaxID=3064706 RepID=UPI00271B692F|nr:succinate dehydrogenase iron-sulfur subunit [Haliea sp. E1-2-M8]MDO8863632.1 succinate dehydrogenase iron-sulfur subunit [Haliea sp. E1-2-M8]